MEITVIIPSYKPQSYLWECLDSLKNQTFPKDRFEIYLILNGCCEPYKEDIETYIATDFGENFHLIQTDIAGVSNARNIGINLSKGEYITFLDDDDYVSPLFLEELYAKAANDTISICYPYAFIDGNTSQIFPYHLNSQFEKRAKQGKLHFLHAWKFFAGPWMKLIPRRIIGSRRFNLNYKNGEDGLFLFAISDRFKWITFTSEKAIYYRRYRKGSAMTSEIGRASCRERASSPV